MYKALTYLTFGAILLSTSICAAEEHDPITGTIGIGGIVIDSGNNLNPNSSAKRLDNLNSGADRETKFIPIILPRITWDAGEAQGIKLYLTADPPIEEVGGFALNLGMTYQTAEMGIIDTSIYFTPFEEAWKNPYVTGVDREETDTTKYGFKIGLNRIMGSGFRVQFVYLNDDVDDDVIGALTPELARDGSVYAINVNYSHYVSENLEIRPRFSFRKGDYDGDANSYNKFKFDLEARYRHAKWLVVPRLTYSYSDYDAEDPIFGDTRDVNTFGVSLMTTYMKPFDWEDWSVTALISARTGNANIDFYDTESFSVGASLNYHL